VKDIKHIKNGFYEGYVLDSRGLWARKTFFPDSWSREKVMGIIVEAFDNATIKRCDGGRINAVSKIYPELEILISFEPDGRVITAFPQMLVAVSV